ncbi:MAG: hypothetical protein IJD78_03470 [Clostridia bacterium]|nr:hypothetical protein [Clostridia bacterium]
MKVLAIALHNRDSTAHIMHRPGGYRFGQAEINLGKIPFQKIPFPDGM